jgi:hypothetical protein
MHSKGLKKACVDFIRSRRVRGRSAFVVTYVRWRCQATTKLYGSSIGCVIISSMILNRAILRYRITFNISTYITCTYKCVYYSK